MLVTRVRFPVCAFLSFGSMEDCSRAPDSPATTIRDAAQSEVRQCTHSVVASYKPPMLVTRARFPVCAVLHFVAARSQPAPARVGTDELAPQHPLTHAISYALVGLDSESSDRGSTPRDAFTVGPPMTTIHMWQEGPTLALGRTWAFARYADVGNASAGNRTRVTSMATMYSTTRPLMLLP